MNTYRKNATQTIDESGQVSRARPPSAPTVRAVRMQW